MTSSRPQRTGDPVVALKFSLRTHPNVRFNRSACCTVGLKRNLYARFTSDAILTS